MNQRQVLQFCKEFYKISIPETLNRIRDFDSGMEYVSKEMESLKGRKEYVLAHRRAFENRYKRYLRDSKFYGASLESSIFRVIFKGVRDYAYSRIGVEDNVKIIDDYIAEKQISIEGYAEEKKLLEKQYRKLKYAKFPMKQLKETAKTLAKATRELKITDLHVEYFDEGTADEYNAVQFNIEVINPVPEVIKEYKGDSFGVRYDLMVRVFTVDGDVEMKLTPEYVKKAKGHTDYFRPHIHASAVNLDQWSGMCVGNYKFNKHFREMNPVTLLYSVHYMLHTFNKFDNYGNYERQEEYVNQLMPKAFFYKTEPSKKKKVETSNPIDRENVKRWLNG